MPSALLYRVGCYYSAVVLVVNTVLAASSELLLFLLAHSLLFDQAFKSHIVVCLKYNHNETNDVLKNKILIKFVI